MAFSDKRHQSNKNLPAVLYHDIFSYPLRTSELLHWHCNFKLKRAYKSCFKNDFVYLNQREGLINLRVEREKIYVYKMQIAKNAARCLARIQWVKFVGITGSLAMKNASKKSDIDLLIITSSGLLWVTRLVCYFWLNLNGFSIRKAGDREEKDKLCLNIWLDETDLYFPKQNIFTAHEIAQIVPLFNKDQTYERLINSNKWITNFWPNAVKPRITVKKDFVKRNLFIKWIENLCFRFQYNFMKSRITKEEVSLVRALFHPTDWGEKVLDELKQRGVVI